MPPETPVHDDIRQGFVYERVPRITLKSIANNPLSIDDIWKEYQPILQAILDAMNHVLGTKWNEWDVTLRASRKLAGSRTQCME